VYHLSLSLLSVYHLSLSLLAASAGSAVGADEEVTRSVTVALFHLEGRPGSNHAAALDDDNHNMKGRGFLF